MEFLPFPDVEPSLNFFHIVPNLDYYTLLRRFSFKRGYILSCSEKPSAGGFDHRLRFWSVFPPIQLWVSDVDLGDVIDRRFGLSVKGLNRRST